MQCRRLFGDLAIARSHSGSALAGIRVFQEHELSLSLSCVVLRSGLHALPFTYQIADIIDAGKLKLITPLRKGNALDLDEHEFMSNAEAETTFHHLTALASAYVWRPIAAHQHDGARVPSLRGSFSTPTSISLTPLAGSVLLSPVFLRTVARPSRIGKGTAVYDLAHAEVTCC